MDPKQMDMIKYVVAAIIAIVGLVILIHGLYKRWKYGQIASWPTVSVTALTVDAKPANAAAGVVMVEYEDLSTNINDKSEYTPDVTYRYVVDGKTYTNSEFIYNSESSYTSIEMRKLLEPMIDGTAVAYYNPDDPDEAYIYNVEPNLVYPLLGVMIIVIGGFIGGYTKYAASKRKEVVVRGQPRYLDGLDTALDRAKTEATGYYNQGKKQAADYYNKMMYADRIENDTL